MSAILKIYSDENKLLFDIITNSVIYKLGDNTTHSRKVIFPSLSLPQKLEFTPVIVSLIKLSTFREVNIVHQPDFFLFFLFGFCPRSLLHKMLHNVSVCGKILLTRSVPNMTNVLQRIRPNGVQTFLLDSLKEFCFSHWIACTV